MSQKEWGGESMAQITIRSIDPEVEQEIRKISRMTGKSLNKVILEMIYNYTGFNKKKQTPPSASLRKLSGNWSDKEASNFLRSIASCEQIDEDMWK